METNHYPALDEDDTTPRLQPPHQFVGEKKHLNSLIKQSKKAKVYKQKHTSPHAPSARNKGKKTQQLCQLLKSSQKKKKSAFIKTTEQPVGRSGWKRE
jgi:hypothetical protein